MPNPARIERERLADLLAAAGPDAPTLCTGWTARDLAAHLVLRERRPDAAPGIRLRPMAGWTARVQAGYARRPYPELVRMLREGPPALSPFALPGVDAAANLVEFFVHAEDVRRADGQWRPGPQPPGPAEELWRRLPTLARWETRSKSPVGLVLRRPDGRSVDLPHRTAPTVAVTGEPGELVLFAFGRGARTTVEAEGPPAALEALRRALPLP
jgi:uncharacterized protein (TIGR03085 family)